MINWGDEVATFNNFEEFWAALDRLYFAIMRTQALQQRLAERLARTEKTSGAKPGGIPDSRTSYAVRRTRLRTYRRLKQRLRH